jgi:UDP-N-acetylglucosamine acyltransferase
MAQVHSLAIVDPKASLAADVTVGPFCWVGAGVTLEEGVVLESHVRVEGNTTLGRGVRVHAGAVLGGPPQDLKYKGQVSYLTVGERTVIRECATANLASDEGAVTRIGSDCLIMAYAHIAHNTVVGDHCILANGVQLAGYVTVEDWAIIGGLVPVHQFVHVGAHSMVGGGCRVPQDVAPYIRAAGSPVAPIGLNVIGLQRRGFAVETIEALRKAYRLLFRAGLRVEEAAARIRAELPASPEIEHFVTFALESKRGLAR